MLLGSHRISPGLIAIVVLAMGATRPAFAAPALKPSPKEQQRKVLLQKLRLVEEKLQGEFERVKIGRDPVSDLTGLINEFGALRQVLAETPEDRVEAAAVVLRQLVITEEQMKELMKAGLQTKEGLAEVAAARQRAADLLESLMGGR